MAYLLDAVMCAQSSLCAHTTIYGVPKPFSSHRVGHRLGQAPDCTPKIALFPRKNHDRFSKTFLKKAAHIFRFFQDPPLIKMFSINKNKKKIYQTFKETPKFYGLNAQ